MQNLRFRERGPFKTWRPETMAEAIMAVLREGLSLSQVRRRRTPSVTLELGGDVASPPVGSVSLAYVRLGG